MCPYKALSNSVQTLMDKSYGNVFPIILIIPWICLVPQFFLDLIQ